MVGTRKYVTFILLKLISNVCFAFHCISPSGQPVDWYIIYKLPIITDSPDPVIHHGTGFFYMDETNTDWSLSKYPVNGTTQHPVYNTLEPIYKSQNTSPYMYMMYNDEPPKHSASLSHGHCKGVVAFNSTTGFWLIHSVPMFPPQRQSGYSWPNNAYDYGQTFLCVTYNIDMLDVIGLQMQYIYPKIFDKYWPAEFTSKYPNMADVLAHYRQKHITDPPFNREVLLKSKGQLNLHSFAKSADFHDDLYAAWIAPRFQDSIATETWRNGAGNLESNCTIKYKVYNIQDVSFIDTGILFKSTKDHSKWAITKDRHGYWTCIGDINRQRTQFKRGGGTVCLSNFDIWNSFVHLVGDYETCGILS